MDIIDSNPLNTPKNLLLEQGINYDSLPIRVGSSQKENSSLVGRVVRKIVGAVWQMTVVGPIFEFSFNYLVYKISQSAIKKASGIKLSPLAETRREEREQKIREIAKEAGIAHPNDIKLVIHQSTSPASASGKILYMRPEYLVKPEDLPDELTFQQLDEGKISEEAWIIKFNNWIAQEFAVPEETRIRNSQSKIDTEIEYGKAFLRIYRSNEFDQTTTGIIGHELGHMAHCDSTKTKLVALGWDLLALPTLGISSLFKERVMRSYNQNKELQADQFSAKHFGSEGISKYFQEILQSGKDLRKKYTDKFSEHGDNLTDRDHPTLVDRIAKLKGQ